MAYPDLYSDETIVLNAKNIKVKSVSFEAVLTTRRLILVDSKKHLIAPQEILLATIRESEEGENAIRDPTITLSIITPTGATRQMILTFSKVGGGDRKRECDEWIRVLRQVMASSVRHPIMPDPQYPPESYPTGEEIYPASSYTVEAANVPAMPAQKKKIEVARPGPIKTIAEPAPFMPKPVETSSLPTGSFCNRCGSRVPPESAFCNKCGTPVVTDSDLESRLAAANEPPALPASTVPQVHMHSPPVYGVPNKDRPIEDVIHSIEPLIEDSVPRTTVTPAIPSPYGTPFHESPPQQVAPPAPADPPAAVQPLPETPAATTGVSWPVIAPAGEAPSADAVPVESAPAGEPPVQPPPLPSVPVSPARRSKKPLIIGALVVIVLIIIGAVVFLPSLTGGAGTPATEVITPSPTASPAETTVPVTATRTRTIAPVTTAKTNVTVAVTTAASSGSSSIIPDTGVWVRVVYANTFKGSLGTPGDQLEVYDTGDKVYQIPTSEGIVSASIQKLDGSSEKLLVEVYKDGSRIAQKSSGTPKGVVEVLADLKPSPTPTPTPTPAKVVTPVKTTTVANTTANASATTST